MSLSPKEAAHTLSDVERAARRSGQAYGYRKASPHLILWGLIWIVGYAGTDLHPEYANVIWLTLSVLGSAGSFFLGYRDRPAHAPVYRNGWRMLGLVAIVLVFLSATVMLIGGVNAGPMMGVVAPLLIGAIYAGAGLWLGSRFVITGLVIIALTLGGYFYLHDHFLLWMAFIGGGGLVLAGFWLRRV